jgi:hypothetical protein
MEDKDLKPFGVEFLEPLEKTVRGGEMEGADCCKTFFSDITGDGDVGSFSCGSADSCVGS